MLAARRAPRPRRPPAPGGPRARRRRRGTTAAGPRSRRRARGRLAVLEGDEPADGPTEEVALVGGELDGRAAAGRPSARAAAPRGRARAAPPDVRTHAPSARPGLVHGGAGDVAAGEDRQLRRRAGVDLDLERLAEHAARPQGGEAPALVPRRASGRGRPGRRARARGRAGPPAGYVCHRWAPARSRGGLSRPSAAWRSRTGRVERLLVRPGSGTRSRGPVAPGRVPPPGTSRRAGAAAPSSSCGRGEREARALTRSRRSGEGAMERGEDRVRAAGPRGGGPTSSSGR